MLIPIAIYIVFGFIFYIPFEDWVDSFRNRAARISMRLAVLLLWPMLVVGVMVRRMIEFIIA